MDGWLVLLHTILIHGSFENHDSHGPISRKISVCTKYCILFLRSPGSPLLGLISPSLMTLVQRQSLTHHFCQLLLTSLLIGIHIT